MKRTDVPASFDPATGAVDCSNIAEFSDATLLAILDVTAKTFLFDAVTPGLGLSHVSGSTVFVEVDTTGLSALDSLLVIWDHGGPAKVSDVSNAVRAPIYGKITVTTSATSLSDLLDAVGVSIPDWATVAYLTPEVVNTIAIRWRADGTAPTSTIGDPVFGFTKDSSVLGAAAIAAASLVSATGGDVAVSVRLAG